MQYMTYCNRCMYPGIAVNLDIDDEGICSSCRGFEEAEKIKEADWKQREKKLVEILETARNTNKGDYDCIIPVGGGKDSYWQVHKIKELGFDPLLVTYHGNNYLPEGQKNLDRMAEVFNCDHYIFHPGVDTLIKLNRLLHKPRVTPIKRRLQQPPARMPPPVKPRPQNARRTQMQKSRLHGRNWRWIAQRVSTHLSMRKPLFNAPKQPSNKRIWP